MVDKLLGKWKLEKNEDFEDFMKSMGVNIFLRKMGNSITSYETISRDEEGNWVVDITSTFRSSKLEFKLGEEFDEQTMDGRKVKSTFTIEGNKLINEQKPTEKNDVPSRYEREVSDDGRMVLTCINPQQNKVGKRYFLRE